MTESLIIAQAEVQDAEDILYIQRAAFESEAQLYNDWNLPPLKQTLEEMQNDILNMTVLKARKEKEIVGSVRAQVDKDGACEVGRLVVKPGMQKQGIGTQLMNAIEQCFPEAARFLVFTGHKSEGNISLYSRLGYKEVARKAVAPHLTLVHLEKKNRAGN